MSLVLGILTEDRPAVLAYVRKLKAERAKAQPKKRPPHAKDCDCLPKPGEGKRRAR